MEIYQSFAQVYDSLMDDVPYADWAAWVTEALRRRGIADGLVLDLGCGTGSLTVELARAGYDMIGVDGSPDMLIRAREKAARCAGAGGEDILLLSQDIRELELYGTVRAVVSACDTLNYILEEEELREVFRLVNNYLDPGGIFLFDMNTAYKYEHLLGDHTFAEEREDCAYIWENTWYPDERINEYDLTLFVPQPGQGEPGTWFRRFHERHIQRCYTRESVERLLREAGMIPEAVYGAYTWEAPGPACERLLFAASEHGK